ncbi:glycosyltransferase [Candidatus Parabeggiatoa sp. HSG14]|uniref:glycosyltransferase n=1 Tax=Candidatus Parabeggiatoa sp. HSG14 TaxID=3055593 RepID=UPI0025A90701|nr:glycosyltransferase [Thiotrichales bacterium HSG14]
MQIIVLGMHRSGTSVVARLLNMMGTYFAPENIAMPHAQDNPKGHWERKDIYELNHRTMSTLGMSWDNISDFESAMLTDETRETFTPDAQKIIFNLETNRPWMAKDPRFCLLLPLWSPLLEVPVCVYVYRNPIQIAQSLKKRDNFPFMLSIALWEKYTLHGLANSVDMPRILVSHEDLMTNPVRAVKNLHQDLLDCEVQGIRLPSDKEIRAFIEPELYHEHGDVQLKNAYLNSQQFLLSEAFENGSIFQLKPLPTFSEGAEEILREYKKKLVATEQALQYQRDIALRDEKITQRDGEIAKQIEEIAQREQEIAQRDEEIAKRDNEISKCHEKIVELQESLEKIERALKTQKTESEKSKNQAASYRNQLLVAEKQINALEQESSKLEEQKQALQTQLTQAKNTQSQTNSTLAKKEQVISTLTKKTEKQQHNIHKLTHWIKALDDDIKAVFNSMTWRSGNIFTQVTLKLMFKKMGLTAQDHLRDIMTEIVAWQQSQAETTSEQSAVSTLPSSIVSSEQGTSTKPLVITTSLQPSKSLLQHNPSDYSRWLQNYDTLTKKVVKQMQQCMKEWNDLPFISIVMPTYNTEEKWLREVIESVIHQIYPNWELCIADDASTKPHVRHILEEYAKRDKRIKLQFRAENGHISAASNTALEMVNGEFIGFLDHDDKLAQHALFWMAQDILNYPDAMLWYSDEDKINKKGERCDPYFKSDWNPDLFLSHNLITHFAVYRTSLIQQIGGFREGYEGAQDYDLALRAIEQINPIQIRHIPRILYHWRIISGSTASGPDEKPYAIMAAQKAIKEHLERRNISAEVTESPDVSGTIRVHYSLPLHLPLVSLIIPTHNGFELLHRCVESILNKTDYENFEILIINNNSDDATTLDYMQQLEADEKARIIDYSYPFNYADMNNMAVEQAQGEVIGLLNNDLEVINHEWLSEMVSHALRPEVGTVGAKLWYPNDTLQHGGVVIGICDSAGHAHKGLSRGDVGYLGRAALIQNFSAVTAACMVMRKANFLAVGGLDAENLSTAFNDVDLCLKMNEHNLRIVWTPYAELYHHESASRGYEDTPEKKARFEKERTFLKNRWPQFFMQDPAYSPNLTIEGQDFAFSWPPRVPSLP